MILLRQNLHPLHAAKMANDSAKKEINESPFMSLTYISMFANVIDRYRKVLNVQCMTFVALGFSSCFLLLLSES